MKRLTSIADLTSEQLLSLVDRASSHRDTIDTGHSPLPSLTGVVVAPMFFEPSTRTRLSFEMATSRLGGTTMSFTPETSSSVKGESLRDTALTLTAIGADVMVVRHSEAGAPDRVSEWTGVPVVNAGDGAREHPTQALIDIVTLVRRFGAIEGTRVVITGDIAHSRVAGSLIPALVKLGASVALCAPSGWLPKRDDVTTTTELEPALREADVAYLLRVQTERGGEVTDRYVNDFQLDRRRSELMARDAVIMHPGPMNRGVEISDSVADGPRSLILEQVRNGPAARMAALEYVTGTLG